MKITILNFFFDLHSLTLLGVLFIAIGTILIHNGNQKKSGEKIKDLKSSLENSNKKLESLQANNEKQVLQLSSLQNENQTQSTKLDNQDNQLENLSKANTKLSFELAEASNKLTDRVMGGNSYPELFYSQSLLDPESITIYLKVVGENPIFDLIIEHMVSLNVESKVDKDGNPIALTNEERDIFLKKLFNAPTLKGGNFVPSETMFSIGNGKVDNSKNEIEFIANIWARNGSFSQVTKIAKSQNRPWSMTNFKLYKRLKGGKRELINESPN